MTGGWNQQVTHNTNPHTNLWGRSGVHSGGSDGSGCFAHSGAGELLGCGFGHYARTLQPAHTQTHRQRNTCQYVMVCWGDNEANKSTTNST